MVRRIFTRKLKRFLPYILFLFMFYIWIYRSNRDGGGNDTNKIVKQHVRIKPETTTKPINNVPYDQKPTKLHKNTVFPPTHVPDLALGRASDNAPDNAPTDQPISVLLLGYQRTGSSFLGQLFNKYPNNYYVFEPVDGIYSALYGIKPGWALASDIVRHWNGTKRSLPPEELASLTSVLTSLLTCDLSNVPAEVMGHPFFQQFEVMQTSSKDYINCLRETSLDLSLVCGSKLSKMCPEIFGIHPPAQERCLWALAKFKNDEKYAKEIDSDTWLPDLPVNKTTRNLEMPGIGLKRGSLAIYKDPYTDSGQNHFKNYVKCVDKQRKMFVECVPMLQKVCHAADMRAIKTVRLTMRTAEELMHRVPNLHVIHLMRDPRAVVASRLAHPSYRSHFARENLTLEAKVYCDALEDDLKVRDRIEKKYHNRVQELVYEKFMMNKLDETARVYKFMKKQVPQELTNFLVEGMHNTKVNSTKIISKWRTLVGPEVEKQIKTVCQSLFKKYGSYWSV